MKKTIIALFTIIILLFSTPSFAAWTLSASDVSTTMDGHIFRWKILCTSDGSALSATNILASTVMDRKLKSKIQSSLLMIMDVEPGTGSVVPNTTIDITLSNAEGDSIYATTAVSKAANTTGLNLSEDWNQFLPVHEIFYLTLNDIGDSGDQVTLYFTGWIERN